MDGAASDFIKLLSQAVNKSVYIHTHQAVCILYIQDPTKFTNNKIRIKISLDGANYSRSSNFCILSFAVLCGGELNQSSMEYIYGHNYITTTYVHLNFSTEEACNCAN